MVIEKAGPWEFSNWQANKLWGWGINPLPPPPHAWTHQVLNPMCKNLAIFWIRSQLFTGLKVNPATCRLYFSRIRPTRQTHGSPGININVSWETWHPPKEWIMPFSWLLNCVHRTQRDCCVHYLRVSRWWFNEMRAVWHLGPRQWTLLLEICQNPTTYRPTR